MLLTEYKYFKWHSRSLTSSTNWPYNISTFTFHMLEIKATKQFFMKILEENSAH